MKHPRPIRTALVGCGTISGIHADCLAKHPADFTLVGCADIALPRAEEFSRTHGVTATYTDYREMVEKEHPELLILGTWPAQHEEQVTEAAAQKVPMILCEKSLAMNAPSAARMAKAAAETGTVLVEGFMWRHHPRTLAAQRLVAEGRIGNLRKIRAGFQRTALTDTAGTWKSDPRVGGGVLFDFTCYGVNAVGAFTSQLPRQVSAFWDRTPEGLVTAMHALLQFPDGLVAIIESSYTYGYHQPLELHGEEGIIRIDNTFTPGAAEGIEVTPTRKARKFELLPAPAASPHEEQLLHLRDCLRDGLPPRFSIEESVRNHAVLDALVQSAETGITVAPIQP